MNCSVATRKAMRWPKQMRCFSTAAGTTSTRAKSKLIALLGVHDLIVVDTPDALLIADRSRAQQVGDLVKQLEKEKRDNLL